MIRNVVGFAGLAVVALLGLKLLTSLFGLLLGIFFTLLWLAFWGWVVYMIIKVISPSTAERVRETIRGKPAA